MSLAIGALILGTLVLFWTSSFGRNAASRLVLWIGILAPIVYSDPQTRGSLLSSGLSSLEVARGLTPVACLVIAHMLSRTRRRRLGVVECLLAAYLALALLSTLWSIAPKQTALKALVLIASVLCVWSLIRRYDSPQRATRGLGIFVQVVLLTVAAEALVAYHRAFSGGRLQGVFPQIAPDVLGTLAVIGVLAVIFSVGPRAPLPSSLRLVLGIVYVAELVATETRSAMVFGAIVVMLSIIPWALRSSATLAILLFGSVVALGTLFLVAPAVQQHLQRGESDVTIATLNVRTTAWAEGLQAWSTARLDGLGYYSGHRFGPVLEPGQGESTNLDNTWIESLVDLGVAGTVLLGGFVLAANGRLLRSRSAVSFPTYVFVISTSLMYFATSFVNPTVAGNESMNFVVWIFVLLLFPLLSRQGRESGQKALAVDVDALR